MAADPSTEQRIAEATELFKRGQKLAKGGIFAKKNPDDAEKLFEEARKKLRPIRPVTEDVCVVLLPILEELASVRYEMNQFHGAATILEEAARTVKSVKQNSPEEVMYLRQSAGYQRMNKQYEPASKTLQQAALIAGTRDVEEGLNIFDESLDIMVVENRFKTCHEFYDAAVKFAVENKKYLKAIQYLQQQIKQFERDINQFIRRIHRNICSIMIIHFHLKNVKDAERVFAEASNVYGIHGRCNELTLCLNLLTAFQRADAEMLEGIRKSGDFGMLLINAVSKVATNLNMVDIQASEVLAKKEKEEMKEEVKEDVTDEMLQSEAQNIKLDDGGAPNLMD